MTKLYFTKEVVDGLATFDRRGLSAEAVKLLAADWLALHAEVQALQAENHRIRAEPRGGLADPRPAPPIRYTEEP
jgi:Holliday junction resolvase